MIESSSLVKKLGIAFDELVEDFSEVNSGILFIQIQNHQVISFGVRERSELESDTSNQIIQQERTGLSPAHQKCFRIMTIEVFKMRDRWVDGEMRFRFGVKDQMLQVSSRYWPSGSEMNI